MPDLNCNVTECGHNAQGLCKLQHIDVSGGGRLADTCCASFTALRDLSFLSGANSVARENAEYVTGVKCGARDCHYNFSECCSADRISIASGGSAHNCGETKCATYRKT